jgi:hypothetical protein
MAHTHDADLRVVTPSGFPRVWRRCSFNVSRQLQTSKTSATTRPSDGLLLGVHVKLRHRSMTGDVHLYGDGSFHHPRASPSVREADISLNQRWPCLSLLPINVSYADCTVVSREFIAILTEAFWQRSLLAWLIRVCRGLKAQQTVEQRSGA